MQRIIDFHTHLGDIFHENRNITFKTNIKKEDYDDPFIETEESGYTIPLIPESEEDLKRLIDGGQFRSWEWTLENMAIDMDLVDMTYAVLLPILPNTSFEEYLAASKLDSRLLPFSSIDYNLSEEEIANKLKKDIARGAKGLKIHPTLQNHAMDDPKTEVGIQVFGNVGLPTLFHVGTNPYYTPDKPYPTNPEFSKLEDFFDVVRKFPDYNLVAAHCCTIIEEFVEGVKGFSHVYTDTTMCSAERMQQGVELLGEDYILFGSDAPFGRIECSVNEMKKAFADRPEIGEKTFYQNAARLMKL